MKHFFLFFRNQDSAENFMIPRRVKACDSYTSLSTRQLTICAIWEKCRISHWRTQMIKNHDSVRNVMILRGESLWQLNIITSVHIWGYCGYAIFWVVILNTRFQLWAKLNWQNIRWHLYGSSMSSVFYMNDLLHLNHPFNKISSTFFAEKVESTRRIWEHLKNELVILEINFQMRSAHCIYLTNCITLRLKLGKN